MSGRKTFAGAIAALAIWGVAFADAEPVLRTIEDRLVQFAQCAGRFSARMEHDWLLGFDGASARNGRRHMVALIEAIGPQPGLTGRDVLALRIDAKMAHAALLQRATFADEPQAARMARRFLAQCEALLPAEIDLAALR